MSTPLLPVLVAVVAFHGISPFHLSVPCIVFGSQGAGGVHPFKVQVCSAEPPPLSTSAGFSLSDLAPLSVLRQADVVVVPSWRDVDERPPEALLAALTEAHARGAMIVGLCLGAHVLAQARLLDGRRATTHWEYAEAMARRYPAVALDAEVLYVEDGNILTSAGTAAGIDACLHLVRQRLGADAANRIARRLVVPPHRHGGQAQFIKSPVPDSVGGARLARLLDSVRERLQDAHSLDSLAAEACMSRRSLSRQFKALTGTTVQSWLLSERLALSQRLLEKTDHSVERIADLAGYGSVASLRHHYRQALGVSPTAWRRSFASRAGGR